eukprot:859522-Prorocentrum_minimum.AAC.2
MSSGTTALCCLRERAPVSTCPRLLYTRDYRVPTPSTLYHLPLLSSLDPAHHDLHSLLPSLDPTHDLPPLALELDLAPLVHAYEGAPHGVLADPLLGHHVHQAAVGGGRPHRQIPLDRRLRLQQLLRGEQRQASGSAEETIFVMWEPITRGKRPYS